MRKQTLSRYRKNPLFQTFELFNAPEGGSPGAPAPVPAPAPEPTSAPAPQPTPTPTPDLAAITKKLEEAEAKLASLTKEKEDAAEAERQKNLTAEQKAAELEAKAKKAEREALIASVRLKHGFTDKVYESVAVSGDDEDAIKLAYEAHKTALDEYMKSQGPKAGQGGGTGDGKSPSGETKSDASSPYLVRMGLVKDKKAV